MRLGAIKKFWGSLSDVMDGLWVDGWIAKMVITHSNMPLKAVEPISPRFRAMGHKFERKARINPGIEVGVKNGENSSRRGQSENFHFASSRRPWRHLKTLNNECIFNQVGVYLPIGHPLHFFYTNRWAQTRPPMILMIAISRQMRPHQWLIRNLVQGEDDDDDWGHSRPVRLPTIW